MIKSTACQAFIEKLPKAELHVHFDGTMQPSQCLSFAQRNNILLPPHIFNTTNDSYQFSDFISFCNTYWQATQAVRLEQDFYDIVYAYLKKVALQGVLHTEIFFDLQTYVPRGIHPGTIINGLYGALVDGKKDFGISGFLILCFIRNFSEEDAFKALKQAFIYRDKIVGIGLAALENGNPPSKFERVFAQARMHDYRLVAHVAESQNDPAAIKEALNKLHIERIDHGIGCMNDPRLIDELAEKQIPLTICPLSNIVLGLFKKLDDHPLKKLFNAGIMTTINSDDPAFFGGYIGENFLAAAQSLEFSCQELVTCARYSFKASFLDDEAKKDCLAQLEAYAAGHTCSQN